MRFFKLGIISIIFFSIFLTLFSLLFPSHVRISKALEIRAGKDSVIRYLTDSSCLATWNSTRNLRTTTITVLKDTLDVTLNGKNPGAGFTMLPASIPHAFTVQYYLDFHLRWYPWEKFSSLLMEKKYGTMMEKDLDKLRSLLEKN
jgi:hypothetical protein